ncbi:MAG: LysR family transcriptional regulator [Sphingomonadales bacterium]|nr:LysR family transcriptional regulator [Sphingomonadales bacterium]
MTIELRQLRYAVATADAKSFARAAALLNVKQISLSRRVQQLEDRLNVKMFERSTRGAELTEHGRVCVELARRIITDVDNLQTIARNVSYGLQGRITVGFCTSLMSGNLKLAIADYLTKFPDVQFDGEEAGPDDLLHGLHLGTLDLAVAPIGLEEEGLASRPAWAERILVALPVDHELLTKDRIYWQDLRREVFVVQSGGLGPSFANLIAARLTEQSKSPAIIRQNTSLESVVSIVSAKRFITIATEASHGVNWPDIEFREIFDGNGPTRLDYAFYWRDGNTNPALKQFFTMIGERYPG